MALQKELLEVFKAIRAGEIVPVKREFRYKELTTTQDHCYVPKLSAMLRQGDPKIHLRDEEKLPIVVRLAGKNYLIDGHHRALWHLAHDRPLLCYFHEA